MKKLSIFLVISSLLIGFSPGVAAPDIPCKQEVCQDLPDVNVYASVNELDVYSFVKNDASCELKATTCFEKSHVSNLSHADAVSFDPVKFNSTSLNYLVRNQSVITQKKDYKLYLGLSLSELTNCGYIHATNVYPHKSSGSCNYSISYLKCSSTKSSEIITFLKFPRTVRILICNSQIC